MWRSVVIHITTNLCLIPITTQLIIYFLWNLYEIVLSRTPLYWKPNVNTMISYKVTAKYIYKEIVFYNYVYSMHGEYIVRCLVASWRTPTALVCTDGTCYFTRLIDLYRDFCSRLLRGLRFSCFQIFFIDLFKFYYNAHLLRGTF